MLLVSFVAPLSFWIVWYKKNQYLISHNSQMDRPGKGFSWGLVPFWQVKTCFFYFKVYSLQAAIDSFAVLSPGKIHHGGALRLSWVYCKCISKHPHLPSTIINSLSGPYSWMSSINARISQGAVKMFWITCKTRETSVSEQSLSQTVAHSF